MHKKGRKADGQDVSYHFQSKFEIASLKVQTVFFIRKVGRHPDKTAQLRKSRRQGSPAYAPLKPENKQRSQGYIDTHGEQGRPHGLFGVTRSPHDTVQPQEIVVEHVGYENDLHKIPGVRQGFGAGSEQNEQVVQKN
ncbi:MAG: hypothetical protein BWX77_00739 [Bacteroidetes bacterium ADurb.Bin090]|nr:MAG: hypothetical protein BWX77_00739 [Bacteroidetes bacterium ADurb.Bin090]